MTVGPIIASFPRRGMGPPLPDHLLGVQSDAMMRRILSMLPILVLLVGCGKPSAPAVAGTTNMTQEQFAGLFKQEKDKADAWFAALDTAKLSAPLVAEFQNLFPDALVRHKYFGTNVEPGFDVSVVLYGRYELTMQLPVHFAPSGRAVAGYAEPQFYLVEAVRQNGRETLYNPAGERRFRSSDWRRLVESGGDFSAIGCIMITNQPVAGFKRRKVENSP